MFTSGKYICIAMALSGLIVSAGTATAKRHLHNGTHLHSFPAYNYAPPNGDMLSPRNAASTVCHVPLPYTYTCEP
jgi:hypothetical protein